MHVVLIGQAPGRTSGALPFDGLSGDRLAQHMGLRNRLELRHLVRCLNLLARYPGPSGKGKGDAFPHGRARSAARCLLASLPVEQGQVVLLAGHDVGRACGVELPYLTWGRSAHGHRCAVIPHPSGINRWWNEAPNRDRFAAFVRPLLQSCGLRTDSDVSSCRGKP